MLFLGIIDQVNVVSGEVTGIPIVVRYSSTLPDSLGITRFVMALIPRSQWLVKLNQSGMASFSGKSRKQLIEW